MIKVVYVIMRRHASTIEGEVDRTHDLADAWLAKVWWESYNMHRGEEYYIEVKEDE